MDKNDNNKDDFIKTYLSATIAIYTVTLIIWGLIVLFGERQRLFSNTYKASVTSVIYITQFLAMVYGIFSIYALIKFILNKSGFWYILIPSILIVGKILGEVIPDSILPAPPFVIWIGMVFNVGMIFLSSYILFKLSKK